MTSNNSPAVQFLITGAADAPHRLAAGTAQISSDLFDQGRFFLGHVAAFRQVIAPKAILSPLTDFLSDLHYR